MENSSCSSLFSMRCTDGETEGWVTGLGGRTSLPPRRGSSDRRERAVGTPQTLLGLALVAHSLCPRAGETYDLQAEVQIGIPVKYNALEKAFRMNGKKEQGQ